MPSARHVAALATIAVLALTAAYAVGRATGRADDLAAAVRAATLADVQDALAAGWAAPVDHAPVWMAGADATAAPAVEPTPQPMGGAVEPSPYRCADVPPAVMPEAVRAICGEIDVAADMWGLDPRALALVVIQECPWVDEACTSPMGAQGVAQIMPTTAPEIAAATGLPCTAGSQGVALDLPTNLACGAWYYVQRLRDAAPAWHAGDEAAHVAIAGAGYNGGPGRGAIALAAWRAGGHPCEAPGLPGESRAYCRAFYDRWQVLTASPAAPSVELGVAWRPRP